MTIRTIQTLLTFFISTFSFGQGISKNEILKFKIKSVKAIDEEGKIEKIEFYNPNGYIFKQGSLNDDNKIKIDKEFIYDKNDLLIEERTYDFRGEVHSTTKHLYDSLNKILKSEIMQFGEVDATWIFEYDKNGNKIKETQTSSTMGNSVTKFTYDSENLLIQEDKSNNTIGKEERVTYKYNAAKQLTEKKTLTYYFNTTIKLTYIYNDIGKLIKLVENSSNGVSSITTYEYDKNNLPTKDNWTGSISKLTHKTTYEISYE